MVVIDFIHSLRVDPYLRIVKHECGDVDRYLTVRSNSTQAEVTFSIAEIRSHSWKELTDRLR
jgi:hypothetical protein